MPYRAELPDAALLRDLIVDLLAGACSAPGEKSRIARDAGIHLAALSRTLGGRAMPRQKTAERIAAALPLPHHERAAWMGLVRDYWRMRRTPMSRLPNPPRFDPTAFTALRHRYERVQHGANIAPGNWTHMTIAQGDSYARVHRDAAALVAQLTPNTGDLGRQFTGLCTILTDASSVLGRRAESLYWARRSRQAALLLELPRDDEVWAAYVLEQQVNSLRAEAVELNRIGLHRPALALCRQARQTAGFRSDAGYWSMQIARDELGALADIPRTPLAEIDAVVSQARRAAEQSAHPVLELLDLLLAGAAASAYLAQERPKLALRILQPWEARLDDVPLCGPLHRSRFLTTWAHAKFACGDYDEAMHILAVTRAITESAHLVEEGRKVHDLAARLEAARLAGLFH